MDLNIHVPAVFIYLVEYFFLPQPLLDVYDVAITIAAVVRVGIVFLFIIYTLFNHEINDKENNIQMLDKNYDMIFVFFFFSEL